MPTFLGNVHTSRAHIARPTLTPAFGGVSHRRALVNRTGAGPAVSAIRLRSLTLDEGERFDGTIWEPACGEGHIAKELIAAGYEVVSTDLIDHGYGDGGLDLFAERKARAKHIMTNPPYGRGLADAFLKHTLKLCSETGGTMAMLMNIISLCHPGRRDFYASTHLLWSKRSTNASVGRIGDPRQATTTISKQRYVWMVWKHGHAGPTRLAWLSTDTGTPAVLSPMRSLSPL